MWKQIGIGAYGKHRPAYTQQLRILLSYRSYDAAIVPAVFCNQDSSVEKVQPGCLKEASKEQLAEKGPGAEKSLPDSSGTNTVGIVTDIAHGAAWSFRFREGLQ